MKDSMLRWRAILLAIRFQEPSGNQGSVGSSVSEFFGSSRENHLAGIPASFFSIEIASMVVSS